MSTKNIKEKIDVPKAREEDPVEIQNELLSKMLDQLRTLVYYATPAEGAAVRADVATAQGYVSEGFGNIDMEKLEKIVAEELIKKDIIGD